MTLMTASLPKRFCIALVLVMMIGLHGESLRADENSDLELIPDNILSQSAPEVRPEAAAAEKPYRLKIFLDETGQGNFERGSPVVPTPSDDFSRWNNRISLDIRTEVNLSPAFSFTFADRLSHIVEEHMDPSEDSLWNDLKEIYLTWNAYESDYIDLGRVNVKNGVAMGFNPTDYFKKNAVTIRISEDASVLRENRLGTFMIRGQGVWEKGSLTLIAAPEISHEPDKWWTDGSGRGLQLQRTNDETRFLAKVNVNTFKDLNPEILYFIDDGRSNWGLNLSKGFGDQIVAYVETSIGQRADVISETLQKAIATGTFPLSTFPANTPPAITGSDEIRLRSQLAAGFSYTDKSNRTTNIEYHYNEAGLSPEQWDKWFQAGAQGKSFLDNPATEAIGKSMLGQLWSVRQFAQEAEEPLSRHVLFIRSFWQDALIYKLDLTGIFQMNLEDKSFFIQPLAAYHLGDRTTLSLAFNFFLGSGESEYGSLPQLWNVRTGIQYFF